MTGSDIPCKSQIGCRSALDFLPPIPDYGNSASIFTTSKSLYRRYNQLQELSTSHREHFPIMLLQIMLSVLLLGLRSFVVLVKAQDTVVYQGVLVLQIQGGQAGSTCNTVRLYQTPLAISDALSASIRLFSPSNNLLSSRSALQ